MIEPNCESRCITFLIIFSSSSLNDLYNSVEDGQTRYDIILQIIQFATKTNYSYLIHPHIDSVVEKSQNWGLSDDQKFQLYRVVKDLYQDSENRYQNSIQKYFISYHNSSFPIFFHSSSPSVHFFRVPFYQNFLYIYLNSI